jgi:hypothetical protein
VDAQGESAVTWIPCRGRVLLSRYMYTHTLTTNSCFSNTLSHITQTQSLLLQVNLIILHAFIVASNCVIGCLKTFRLGNTLDGHPTVPIFGLSREKPTSTNANRRPSEMAADIYSISHWTNNIF